MSDSENEGGRGGDGEEETPFEIAKRCTITDGFGKKDTRACMACGLIKQTKQFAQYGCENCPFLELQTGGNIGKFTTRNFAGVVALIDPEGSWVGKWNQLPNPGITGIYAVKLFGGCPSELEELCLEARVACKMITDNEEQSGGGK